jgi:hypothetical protein
MKLQSIYKTGALKVPVLMSKRCRIQLISVRSPFWQEPIHDLHEAIIVVTLKQMSQLVDHNVLDAGTRLFDQFEIQPNSLSINVACAPTGLHAPDAPIEFRSVAASGGRGAKYTWPVVGLGQPQKHTRF